MSDETDSDIDINEDDELKSDVEGEGEAKTAKKLNSKAYKVIFQGAIQVHFEFMTETFD